jgi:hypothetical protein
MRIRHVSAGFCGVLWLIISDGVSPSTASAADAKPAPDFSGTWLHWLRPGFGPPASGPGPITNRVRRNGVSAYDQLVGDYTNPILKPRAAEIVKQHGEMSLKGVGYPTPSNQCWPAGVPYIFWNPGMQMLQEPDKVTFLYYHDHEFRQVRLNQPHPAKVEPSWYGDSVGHYEGDTLVIDTVGVKMGPFAMADMYGTPYSKSLHVVERYRLLEYDSAKAAIDRDAKVNQRYPLGVNPIDFDANYRGKHLQLEIRVEDKEVFTTPWSAVITYGRPLGQWTEHVCAENLNKFGTEQAPRVPIANRADF